MQCAKCQATIEASPSGDIPTSCPECGERLDMDTDVAANAGGGSSRVVVIVLLLLVVAAAAVAAGATVNATRAMKERDRAVKDLARTAEAFDAVVTAAANSSRLRGASAAKAREEVLQPAIRYYQDVVQEYANDEQMLPQVAAANLHLAALQAKLGLPESVNSLRDGAGAVSNMINADFDEESFPSFQDIVLKTTTPADWISVKTPNLQAHAIGLIFAIQSATHSYRTLTERFPESIAFRDDLSALLSNTGRMLGAVPAASANTPPLWRESCDVLETLVRDQPSNAEFKKRLVESLESLAKLQKRDGETKEAIASYQRAVEVREQMAAANPEDKSLANQLASAKSDLEKLTATAPDEGAPPDAAPSEDTPADDTPQQQAPADDATAQPRDQ